MNNGSGMRPPNADEMKPNYDTRDIGVPNEPLRQSRMPSWLPTKLQSLVVFSVLIIIAIVAVVMPTVRSARDAAASGAAIAQGTPVPEIPGLAHTDIGQAVFDATPTPHRVPVNRTNVPVGDQPDSRQTPGSNSGYSKSLEQELKDSANDTKNRDPDNIRATPSPKQTSTVSAPSPTRLGKPVPAPSITDEPNQSRITVNAPQTAIVSGGTAARPIANAANSDAPAQSAVQTQNPNEVLNNRRSAFNSSAGAAPGYLNSRVHDPLSEYEIFAGTPIRVVLEDKINTSLPGDAWAHVIYDVHCSIKPYPVCIPALSRIQLRYNSNVQSGDNRVQIAADTLKFPKGASFDLSGMGGSDTSGEAGLSANVDDHRGRIFTTTLLSAVLSAGLQLSQPAAAGILAAPSAGQQAAGAVGSAIADTGSQLISQQVQRPPTLTIERGREFVLRLRSTIIVEPPAASAE